MDKLENCIAMQTNGKELCSVCELKWGACPNYYSDAVISAHLSPEFMVAARTTMFEITGEEGVGCSAVPFWLIRKNWDFNGHHRHPFTKERIHLSILPLFHGKSYDGNEGDDNSELEIPSVPNLHSWYFHQYRRPVTRAYRPSKYAKRHCTVFSILKAAYPDRCAHWPRL